MKRGIIVDPRFNATEKDFGILSENGTSHHTLYVKDEFSQYLPQGTPVEFRLTERKIDFETTVGSLQETKIEFAVITDYDLANLNQHGFAQTILKFIAETIRDRKVLRKKFRLKPPSEYQNKPFPVQDANY